MAEITFKTTELIDSVILLLKHFQMHNNFVVKILNFSSFLCVCHESFVKLYATRYEQALKVVLIQLVSNTAKQLSNEKFLKNVYQKAIIHDNNKLFKNAKCTMRKYSIDKRDKCQC